MALEQKRLNIEGRKVAVAERNVALAEKKLRLESEQQQKVFDNQTVINKLLEIVQKHLM